MQILVRCPKCDAGLPVAAADGADAIKCGRCGREIPLDVSDGVRADRAVDRCPVCSGADFYIRKDFDPEDRPRRRASSAPRSARCSTGSAATSSPTASWRRGADRSRRLRPAEGRHRLLPLSLRVPRRLPAHRVRVRSAHRGRARAGVRAADRTTLRRWSDPDTLTDCDAESALQFVARSCSIVITIVTKRDSIRTA